MNTIVWLNTADYTYLQLSLFFIGAVSWVAAYVFIVRDIYRNKYVGIPAGTVGPDIAWEFLWTFIFQPDMGFILKLGYYGWFALDVVIVFNTFRYGYKQVQPELQPYFKRLFGFSIAAWLLVLYFFIDNGHDNPIGANSAYLVQIVISLTYLMLLLRIDNIRDKLNVASNWLRMFGSLFIGIMCILRWPQNTWMISMIVIFMILDVSFLVIMYKKLKPISSPA